METTLRVGCAHEMSAAHTPSVLDVELSDRPESLLSDCYIKDNIDVVEEKLKLKIEITQNRNVSVETLQFAASIFTYLNFCPTKDFYVLSVIKFESAENILLALASMMKSSQNAGKKSSTRIFSKAMEIFKLTSYRDIDVITKGKGIDDKRNDFNYYMKKQKKTKQRKF